MDAADGEERHFEQDTEAEVEVEAPPFDVSEPMAATDPAPAMAGDEGEPCAPPDALVPTVRVGLRQPLPEDAAAWAQDGVVAFQVDNTGDEEATFEVVAFIDFGTMYTHKIALGDLVIAPGGSSVVDVDLREHAAKIAQMKYSERSTTRCVRRT